MLSRRVTGRTLSGTETRVQGHPSDSADQREAEVLLLARLSEVIGVELAPQNLSLGEAARVSLDGCSEDRSVLAELYAHIGETKGAQRHKIARDILKLVAVEAEQGQPCCKILGFADQAAARYLRGRSWLAAVVQTLEVEIHIVDLPAEWRDRLLRVQARQVMVNQ